MSDAASIKDSARSVNADQDDKFVVIEVHNISQRYIRIVVERHVANAEIDSILAFQYNATNLPIEQDYTYCAAGSLLGSTASGEQGYGYGYGYASEFGEDTDYLSVIETI